MTTRRLTGTLHADLERGNGDGNATVAATAENDADRISWWADRCERALGGAGMPTDECEVVRAVAEKIRAVGACATDPACMVFADEVVANPPRRADDE